MTVTGQHGMAQASEEQVIVLWDACLFFFPTEHLDDIVALLQALQQEIALKAAMTVENIPTLKEIAQRAG